MDNPIEIPIEGEIVTSHDDFQKLCTIARLQGSASLTLKTDREELKCVISHGTDREGNYVDIVGKKSPIPVSFGHVTSLSSNVGYCIYKEAHCRLEWNPSPGEVVMVLGEEFPTSLRLSGNFTPECRAYVRSQAFGMLARPILRAGQIFGLEGGQGVFYRSCGDELPDGTIEAVCVSKNGEEGTPSFVSACYLFYLHTMKYAQVDVDAVMRLLNGIGVDLNTGIIRARCKGLPVAALKRGGEPIDACLLMTAHPSNRNATACTDEIHIHKLEDVFTSGNSIVFRHKDGREVTLEDMVTCGFDGREPVKLSVNEMRKELVFKQADTAAPEVLKENAVITPSEDRAPASADLMKSWKSLIGQLHVRGDDLKLYFLPCFDRHENAQNGRVALDSLSENEIVVKTETSDVATISINGVKEGGYELTSSWEFGGYVQSGPTYVFELMSSDGRRATLFVKWKPECKGHMDVEGPPSLNVTQQVISWVRSL